LRIFLLSSGLFNNRGNPDTGVLFPLITGG
jgi:hypothetical protein